MGTPPAVAQPATKPGKTCIPVERASDACAVRGPGQRRPTRGGRHACMRKFGLQLQQTSRRAILRAMSAACAAVTTDESLSLCILLEMDSAHRVLTAGSVCKLWLRQSQRKECWRMLCEKTWPGMNVRTQDFKALYLRLLGAEKQALPNGVPQRLEDCALIFASGVGPCDADGQPSRVERKFFDLQSAERVRLHRPPRPGYTLRGRTHYKLPFPGLKTYIESVYELDWHDLHQRLSDSGRDYLSDPMSVYSEHMSCTLVSKLDGRAVRVKQRATCQDIGQWNSVGQEAYAGVPGVHVFDMCVNSDEGPDFNFAVSGENLLFWLTLQGSHPDPEAQQPAGLVWLPWQW